jgi:hypothetical protein
MREGSHETVECHQHSSEAAAMFLLLLYCSLTSLAEFIMEASASFREFIKMLLYLFNITVTV